MAKSYELNGDIYSDTSDNVSDNMKDFNEDLASTDGVDLNNENTSERQEIIALSKTGIGRRFVAGTAAVGASILAPFAPIKNDYKNEEYNVPAIQQEYPYEIKTPEQIAIEMGATIQEGDPVPDNRGIEEQAPLDSEYGEYDK